MTEPNPEDTVMSRETQKAIVEAAITLFTTPDAERRISHDSYMEHIMNKVPNITDADIRDVLWNHHDFHRTNAWSLSYRLKQ